MAYYAPFYRPTYYDPVQQNPMGQFNQQFQQPTNQFPNQQPVRQNNGGFVWIQGGEAGAKSYLVAPGETVMLMDAENPVFFLKSADASGMPMPLRIFDYKERINATTSDFKAPSSGFSELDDKYITREEFEQRMASVASQCQCRNKAKKKEDVTDGNEPTV